jgi:hypothetical protein
VIALGTTLCQGKPVLSPPQEAGIEFFKMIVRVAI